jgi:AcrR family transcriptional regulator
MTQRARESDTEDRILRTFLRLVAKRGIEATTTRVLAEEAGVNEVTIFRLFGDKANLAAQAFRRFSSVEQVAAYPLDIDASSPRRACDDLVELLQFIRARMVDRPEIVEVGMAEYWRFPQVRDEIAATPKAVRALLERALDAAAPVLRPGIDRRTASLALVGFVLVSVVWPARGWIELSDEDFCRAARQTVNGFLRPGATSRNRSPPP